MDGRERSGHMMAVITILIWGTTFISTKILLEDFSPVEILVFRFLLGFLALLLLYPHRLKGTDRKQEATFFAAGFCGICMYYLLENIALTCTLASNVGVIISVAPFFTAVLTRIFMKQEERFGINFFAGFLLAIAGISLISFNGTRLEMNPLGDGLAFLAAFVWACYSVLTKKISSFGYHTIQTTRRVFAYGIVCMLPTLYFFDFRLNLVRFMKPLYAANLLFLGLGASALCFVSWNFAVSVLGAVKTSVYIYMVPVVTVLTSVLILHEHITPMAAAGTLFTLTGLFLSQKRTKL